MKRLDLALLGGAAYLIFSAKGSSAVSGGSSEGFGGAAISPPITLSGKTIPTTTIPTSVGFQKAIEAVATPSTVVQAATAPLNSTIKVTQAPVVQVRSSGGSSTNSPQISAASKSEITQIFQKQYISGAFVPSSVLAGKMTKTDVIIAQNLAKKSFN